MAIISNPEDALILWAESPDEARVFLRKCSSNNFSFPITKIYVAKMSGKSRVNNYTGGQYYTTSNDIHVDAFERTITAPESIINMVQWCTCDIMLSKGDTPVAVLEDTTHIVRMNLFQRIPRIAKAANLGVPSIVLQGTQGIDLSRRGDRWALYRYLKVFQSMASRHPSVPPLPFYYLPEVEDEKRVQNQALTYLSSIINNDDKQVSLIQKNVITQVTKILKNGIIDEEVLVPSIPSIQNDTDKVTVKIGANPDKPSWRTKGSGQMDPYLGMIVAAKYDFCYDENGKQIKPLIVEFTKIPEDFFFFKDREKSKSLYKRLAFELADQVIFCG